MRLMSTSAIELYERLRTAPDEEARARVIAEAFEQLETRYPQIKDLATASDLRETELKLTKEIERVRLEIEQIRAELRVEIEQVRAEQKESELRLTREIERIRSDVVERVAESKASVIRWVAGLLLAQFSAIVWVILRTSGQA